MFSLLLLALTFVLNAIIVRIGGIALEITGIPAEQAGFQALSAYTGAGFTTREAEGAISNPQRRKIIKTLIRIGSIGVISTIAAMVGTLISTKKIVTSLVNDAYFQWLPHDLPVNLTQLILLGLVLFFFTLYKLTKHPPVARLLKELIATWLIKENIVDPVMFENVVTNSRGEGVLQVEICPQNPLVGKQIKEARLEERGITVLSVERVGVCKSYPSSLFRIQEGDRLLCFGPVSELHQQVCVLPDDDKSATQSDSGTDTSNPLPVLSQAPDFALKDQEGNTIQLSDFKGKQHVILVFYPKDNTYTCTNQLAQCNAQLHTLQQEDIQVLGINADSEKSHARFAEKQQFGFPLLTDPGKHVARAYHAVMLGGLLVDRTVYLIDKEGMIRFAQRGTPALAEVTQALTPQPQEEQDPVPAPLNR